MFVGFRFWSNNERWYLLLFPVCWQPKRFCGVCDTTMYKCVTSTAKFSHPRRKITKQTIPTKMSVTSVVCNLQFLALTVIPPFLFFSVLPFCSFFGSFFLWLFANESVDFMLWDESTTEKIQASYFIHPKARPLTLSRKFLLALGRVSTNTLARWSDCQSCQPTTTVLSCVISFRLLFPILLLL